jgi:hypothetical protein
MVRDTSLTSHKVDPGLASFFNGYVATGENTKDPYVSGYAFIKWIKVPKWIGTDEGREFKQLSERNFKALSGLSDMTMDTGAITSGFTNNETSHAKGTVQKAEGFSLKYQEKSGSPETKYYNEWVSGIRDPKTGIATYPKKSGLAYHSSNHTGILLYVVTRPDADNFGNGPDGSNIEFAALYTNVMPTKIILDHFNFESGSHEFAEPTQDFKGYMNIGGAVEKFAASQMSQSSTYKFYNENDYLNMSEVATSVPSA